MIIPKDKRVKLYELTYLVPANLTGDETQAIETAVEKLIAKHKGTVSFQEDWGKKELAYTIPHAGKKHREAVYKFKIVEFEASAAFAFEKELFLNQSILRHLFVVAPVVKVKKQKKAAVVTE